MSLENRIRALEESTPKGYTTFDGAGRPVIQSDLPGLDWFTWAEELFRSKGRRAEKQKLREQLARSEGKDNSGGVLYELVAALYTGPVEGGNDNANHHNSTR